MGLGGPRDCVTTSDSSRTGQAMKEILLAGDTNRLVAELTFDARRKVCLEQKWVWDCHEVT